MQKKLAGLGAGSRAGEGRLRTTDTRPRKRWYRRQAVKVRQVAVARRFIAIGASPRYMHFYFLPTPIAAAPYSCMMTIATRYRNCAIDA